MEKRQYVTVEQAYELTARLARQCARGWRQASLVNELLAGPVATELVPVPSKPTQVTRVYGRTRLPSSSYRNLRARLAAAGFTFAIDRETRPPERFGRNYHVTMTFPALPPLER